MDSNKKSSILILGGGLIGLSVAYEFARNNYHVQILSKKRSEAAGFVAAGMLAPHAEGLKQELLDFGKESQKIIPEWIKNIEIDSGINCGLKKCGILVPFRNFKDLINFPTYKYGQYLNKYDLKNEITDINSDWEHALLFNQDGQIDNRRRLMRALEKACTGYGVEFQEGTEIKELLTKNNKFTGVKVVNATGQFNNISGEKAILCSGAWSKQILNELPIYPVKGQMLSLQGPMKELKRILFGPKTYLVPREDGLVIVKGQVIKMPQNKWLMSEYVSRELFILSE